MKSFLGPAMAAARMAGEILINGSPPVQIEFKDSSKRNMVSNVDLEAERVITEFIKERWPDHQILAEEGGHYNKKDSPYIWIIDPLDGTTNYIHGFPHFSVSIGLEFEGNLIVGVVYEPVRNKIFYAERGKGAFLNGHSIQVSKDDQLSKALLVTGFSYNLNSNTDENFLHFYNFSQAAQAVRRTGSAALDLCYLAAGYFDGYWELNLSPWDTAAGSLIVEEAAGKISGFNGEPFSIYSKAILASNGLLHNQMIEILQKKSQPLP
ncbi:MAG: inositol monophosphatase family protein [Nitrospiria bacterium]